MTPAVSSVRHEKINDIAKYTKCINNDARKITFVLLDCGEDAEYNDIDFVAISKICETLNAFLFWNSAHLRAYGMKFNWDSPVMIRSLIVFHRAVYHCRCWTLLWSPW